jgi:hypothetical protein
MHNREIYIVNIQKDGEVIDIQNGGISFIVLKGKIFE